MINKKLVKAMALIVTTSMMFAGCSPSTPSTPSTPTTPTTPSTPSTPSTPDPSTPSEPTPSASNDYNLGLCLYKFDDTFISTVRAAVERRAKEKETETGSKITISAQDGQGQQATQNDQVDTFITQGFDGIMVNMVDRTAASVIIDKAKSADIPVTFFNREPVAEDMAKWDKIYYVGAKAEESGTMQGQIASELFAAGGVDKNGDGVMQYVMLEGEPGHQDAMLRTEYSIREVENQGIGVERLANDTAMWQRAAGQEKMAAWISAFGDTIEVVFANNDDMALGAIEALKTAGYFGADGKTLPVIGVDATLPALDSIEKNELAGTVLNDANGQGSSILNIAYALAAGEDPAASGADITDGQYCWVPYQPVTPSNVSDFR